MADNDPVEQEVEPVDVNDVEPEPAAEPGERENPLTLEAVHREAFLRRQESAFGDDPTVATPGEDCEPQVSGPGDPDHVVTLAKYARQADVGEDAEDTSGVAGGGLVAVDRETGEPVDTPPAYLSRPGDEIETNDAGYVLSPAEAQAEEDEAEAEDFSKLTVAELKERAVDSGYAEEDVKNLKKDELLALDLS